jgi:glutathione S-transferase
MDWFNTQLNRDLAYGLVYPQAFPHHKRQSDEAQKATLAWAKERAAGWLKVLNDHIIGPKNAYLCGDKITLADYYGAPFAALTGVIRSDLAAYPNVKRWLGNMKKLKSWAKTNEVIDGFAGSLNGPFVTV